MDEWLNPCRCGARGSGANSASDEAVATQTEQRTQDDYPSVSALTV